MKFELGFGTGSQCADIPEDNVLAILNPKNIRRTLTGSDEVKRALAEPIGSPRLKEIVKPGEKIVIITSDITRPCPTWNILPPVLEELISAGVQTKDVTLVFALGIHRKHTEEERKKLAGSAYGQIQCHDSNPADFILMGTTSRGTPVEIDRVVASADRRICLGNIEYHYFAGYSGGAKAIMPGVSTRAAIQANHSRMVDPLACVGEIARNPIRQDIEESAAICGVDFIVNVVLDAHKEIIKAVAGDVIAAHRVGCHFLDSIYSVSIPQKADIVLVSQGGSPKDLNLYQVQKALDNAKHAVRDGGIIILVGSCQEGFGEDVFEDWMLSAEKPEDLIHRIKANFQLGGHKAAAIAMVLQRAEIDLVSEMDPLLVERIFLKPYSNVQEAVAHAFEKLGHDASVIVMPFGGATLPRLERK